MKLICPHCGAERTVDDSYREKMVQCSKCEISFGVFPWRKNLVSEDVEISPVESSTLSETQEEPPVLSDPVPGFDEIASDKDETEEPENESTQPESSLAGPIFPIVGVIKDTWEETKGAKASIWAAIAVLYLVMLLAEAAASFLTISRGGEGTTAVGQGFDSVIQLFISAVAVIFTAGLLYIGVKKVAGEGISWKMIFSGFSFAGQIVLATLLQSIFVAVGLFLFVLPGLYLMVGYSLTLPIIMDRGMSAWEAMEASRRAIHKVWWKVAGTFVLMGLIQFVSAVPFGIGLIWTVPMVIILVGVMYHRLSGAEKT